MVDETEYIKLRVVGQDSNEIHFRLKQTTKMGRLTKSYSERVGVPITSLRFQFDGWRINDDETPNALAMEEDNVIEVWHESNDKIDMFVNACYHNEVSVVRRMMSEGVDINGRNISGSTGLDMAMCNNNKDIVLAILSHSDIQIDNTKGYGTDGTALHYACNKNSVDSVRLFLAHPSCTKDIVNMVAMMGWDGMTAEMMAKHRGNHECARLVREYLSKADKPEEVDDVQRVVKMINSGDIKDEGPTRLEDMTLTKVAESIEKINAEVPIIEAANNKMKDENNEELAKLEVQHKNKLKSLVESHKRKVDGIVDKHTTENNKYKKLRAEKQERKESLHSQLQVLISPSGQPTKPPPPPPSSLIPECPVCFENMKPPLQIFTCGNGHLVCSVCRPKVIMDKCCCCQAKYMGRATTMEQIVRQALEIM